MITNSAWEIGLSFGRGEGSVLGMKENLLIWEDSEEYKEIPYTVLGTEMKFLDINLTKDSSLLFHAIHSPIFWRILTLNILFSGFKNPDKKSAKQEN